MLFFSSTTLNFALGLGRPITTDARGRGCHRKRPFTAAGISSAFSKLVLCAKDEISTIRFSRTHRHSVTSPFRPAVQLSHLHITSYFVGPHFAIHRLHYSSACKWLMRAACFVRAVHLVPLLTHFLFYLLVFTIHQFIFWPQRRILLQRQC